MEQYTSLYRKLRPARFSDIVGQPHISRIMTNALSLGRIGHAYLFSGPRGTGKTTTAKILAKAVNCLEPDGVEPCNQCSACQRISSGRSLDVMEIDGASNRGIDEIRDLREKVRLAPAEEKYKVYIIDEVHMLTSEAFNALLKTLEEPPARVLFVLATTEPHKVPETIISRCLRFDFRRIAQNEIIEYLRGVAQLQEIDVDEQALTLIAKMARGGLRDALSIFEQCTAFTGERITLADVEAVLGKAGDHTIKDLFDGVARCDVAGALGIIEECVAKGSDIGTVFNDILEYLRNILLLATAKDARHLVPYGGEIIKAMGRQLQQFSRPQLFEMADIVAGYARQVRWTNQPQIILELAVIKLCEFGISQARQEEPVLRKVDSEILQEPGLVYRNSGEASPSTRQCDTSRDETAASAEGAEAPVLPDPSRHLDEPQDGSLTPGESPEPGVGFQPGHPQGIEEKVPIGRESGAASEENPTGINGSATVSGQEESGITLSSIRKEWNTQLMRKLKKHMISLHALIVEGVPVDLKNNVLTIGFGSKFKFHKETVDQEKNKKQLESFFRSYFGQDIHLRFIIEEHAQPSSEEAAQDLGVNGKQEIVKKALEIFGGELVSIEDIDIGDGSRNEEGL